jgi:predicted nucleic acid-binding protein
LTQTKINQPILIDTGPIVAILSLSDEHHESCVNQLKHITGPIITCWPVVTEAAWLLQTVPAGVDKLMRSLQHGPFTLATLELTDVRPIMEILNKYADLRVQLADAALLHLANRDGIDDLFTLDRRDFGVLKKTRGKKLRLWPDQRRVAIVS